MYFTQHVVVVEVVVVLLLLLLLLMVSPPAVIANPSCKPILREAMVEDKLH
jgi:hypothetical protein